ncbi:MAG: glycosyltransferase [Mycoplasmatales bacterium]
MKHVFLILNYNNYNDTMKCVESIEKISGHSEIVIVDNDSTTNAFKVLTDLYIDRKEVHVIKTKNNVGFARGNNFGYNYINKNIDFDFVHCLNSDVLVVDEETLIKTENLYLKFKFLIMGPNILTRNKKSSPIGVMRDESDLRKNNARLKFLATIYYYIACIFQPIMGNKLEQIYNRYSSRKVQKKLASDDLVPILSGCYIVFHKACPEKFGFLFHPSTFLYNEESILTYLILKRGSRKILYTNSFHVIHNHAGSSKGNNKAKAKLILENIKNMEDLLKDEKGTDFHF